MSHLDTLRDRRSEISARCDEDRAALAADFGRIEKELHIADKVVTVARGLNRHRVILGVAVAGLILVPVLARKWIRSAAWWLPVAIEGYKMVSKLRSARDS